MALRNDYQRIAHRSIDASDALLNSNLQEKATFMIYHAFESTGCALSLSCNLPVGSKVNHAKKLRIFKKAARTLKNEYKISNLIFILQNMRNELLYPTIDEQTSITLSVPENIISLPEAKKLKNRVHGVVKWVDREI